MRASASSSATRRWASAYSCACTIVWATCAAIATSRSISSCRNSRGTSVRTFSAPARRSRARIGTARIDSYWSSGRFGKALKRGSRSASAGIITGARSAAAVPVIPSPDRMRGRRVIPSTLVPCVARNTSSSARSSYRYTKHASAPSASATLRATRESTSSRSRVELTASIVSVSRRRCRSRTSTARLSQPS